MRDGTRALLAVAALCGPVALAAAAPADPPAMLDVLLGAGRQSVPLSELVERIRLADGEDLRALEIGRDAHSSHHLIAIRRAETPHRHDRHDLTIVMLQGYGSWLLGSEVRRVGKGSILYAPRGTLHAFSNASPQPAIAYVVYSPGFDGQDRATED